MDRQDLYQAGQRTGHKAHRAIIRPWTQFLIFSIGLCCAYLLTLGLQERALTGAVNLAGPLALGAASSLTALRLLRKEPMVVWAPFFWFLAAIVLFYSLGPLTYVLGSEALVHYMASSLPVTVTPEDLLRTNLLNCVGILAVATGVRLGWWLLPVVRKKRAAPAEERSRMKRLTVWLLVTGGIIQFGLTLPWEFGAYDFVLPGIVYNLGQLSLFGLMTLAYLVAAGERRWRFLLYALWAVQLVIALLHFSKTEVMTTMLLPVLGAYMANRDLKRLLVSLMAMAAVYVAIAQLIHYGRNEVIGLSGNLTDASAGQRLEITGRLLGDESPEQQLFESGLSSLETGWARLSYSNVQTFAMDQYDNGWAGDTLKIAAYVLIPRFIWPEKPIPTNVGIDFYELVTGRRGETHLGLGIFGEGYWNLGWFGVVLLGLVTGLVFWFAGVFAMGWMAAGRMEYMPSIFLGIRMGLLGTTGIFANAVVGATGFIVVYALLVSKALAMVSSARGRNPERPWG